MNPFGRLPYPNWPKLIIYYLPLAADQKFSAPHFRSQSTASLAAQYLRNEIKPEREVLAKSKSRTVSHRSPRFFFIASLAHWFHRRAGIDMEGSTIFASKCHVHKIDENGPVHRQIHLILFISFSFPASVL